MDKPSSLVSHQRENSYTQSATLYKYLISLAINFIKVNLIYLIRTYVKLVKGYNHGLAHRHGGGGMSVMTFNFNRTPSWVDLIFLKMRSL